MSILGKRYISSSGLRRLLMLEGPQGLLETIKRRGRHISPGAREVLTSLRIPERDGCRVVFWGKGELPVPQGDLFAERGTLVTPPLWVAYAFILDPDTPEFMIENGLDEVLIAHQFVKTTAGTGRLLVSYAPADVEHGWPASLSLSLGFEGYEMKSCLFEEDTFFGEAMPDLTTDSRPLRLTA